MQNDFYEGITLYGAGGHSKVVVDILEACGERVGHVVDDHPAGDWFLDFPLSLPVEAYDRLIIAIGDSHIRRRIAAAVRARQFVTAIHPTAIVSRRSQIGEGSVVMQGAIVQSGTRIGRHCIINTGSSVDHDVTIGDFCHIAPHATLDGNVQVGECTWIGAGAVIKQGIRIGADSIVGMGAVVVRDVPDGVVAFGNPCRVIRPNLS